MLDFVDRILAALAAFLVVLANDLRLYNFRPTEAQGAFSNAIPIRVFGDTDILYLSVGDLWLRGMLAAGAVTLTAWMLTTAFKKSPA